MGRIASVVLLAAAAACTQSPTPDSCRDDDCSARCRTAGRRAGACSAAGLCVCDGFADAESPDAAEDVSTSDDFAGDAVVPDDAGPDRPDPDAPDVLPDIVDSDEADEGDGAPTDVDWTPGGSHAACSNLMPGTCPAGEICEDDFCPPWGDGVCVTRPASCPPWDHPVCGCNGLTYANECLRLMAGDGPKHDGRCVPGEDEPYCDSMGGWEHYWADRPMGMERQWCTGVACSGCTAECRDDGLPGEGWYAVCPEPPAWDSGGCEDDGLIHLADCL